MKEIIFKDVVKSYDQKNIVLDHLNLHIEDGERVILLGPSGCGKSTTLRIIAGLESITSGELYMGDKIVNDLPASERNISMVFQNYALYPHMTVAENIGYGLKINRVPKDEIASRSKEVVHMLQLDGLEDRKPKDLSGGQRQRVALARAIIKNTDYLLLDEPLSNLDAQLRLHARQELVKLHERYHMTFVYVTHDQVEAMTVGHKIVLLNDGKIQMVGRPHDVYDRPANVFTAEFIGSPPMNVIPCRYESGHVYFEGDNQSIGLDSHHIKDIDANGNDLLYLGIRPESLILTSAADPLAWKSYIDYSEYYGAKTGVYFQIGGKPAIVLSDEPGHTLGEPISVAFPQDKIQFFDRENELNISTPMSDINTLLASRQEDVTKNLHLQNEVIQ